MQRDLRAFLWDAVEAANDIQKFVNGITADGYSRNPMLKAAVERKFEIIGEALRQASPTASRLLPSGPTFAKGRRMWATCGPTDGPLVADAGLLRLRALGGCGAALRLCGKDDGKIKWKDKINRPTL
jgi:hypothetical protein